MSINKDSQKAPNIRFKGFTDDWEERKFIDILDDTDGIRRGPFGSALRKDLFVSESDYVIYEQQNAIYDHFDTRYNISKEKFDELHRFKLEPGDFIMSGAGTIGRISRVPKGIKQGVFNQALIRFRIKNKVTDSDYFLQWIRSDNMQWKFTNANPGSAMTNLVPLSEVKKWGVLVPSKEEQRLLGKFLTVLGNLITLHQRKLDQLKQLKEALLQQMFPGKGETVPKLRFAGFEWDWEERKLGDLLNKNIEKNKDLSIINVESVSNKTGFTKQIEQFEDYSVASADLSNYYVIREQQFAYNPSRINVGSIAYKALGDDTAVVSPLYVSFSTKRELNDGFIWNWFKTTLFDAQRKRLSEGGVRDTLSFNQLSVMDIILPTYLEQEKISGVFKQLDNTITLQQRKLDQLKNTKQVLLQNMFI